MERAGCCNAVMTLPTQSSAKIRLSLSMALLILAAGVLLVCIVPPNVFGAEDGAWHDGSSPLKNGWRTHTGDDPAYARLDYDDNAWPQVSLPQTNSIGGGWRWYRLRVELPSTSPALAVLVNAGSGTYELFLNGKKIPGADLRPAWLVRFPQARGFQLQASGEVEMALRTFVPYGDIFSRGRGILELQIGTEASIADKVGSERALQLARAGPSAAINLLIAIAGIAVLILFVTQRDRFEYLWLGLYLVQSGIADGVWTLIYTGFVPVSANVPANAAGYLGMAALVEFTFCFAGRKVNFGWRAYQLLLGIGALSTCLFYYGIQSSSAFDLEQILLLLPVAVLLPVLLLVWYRRGNQEASWLILPIFLSGLTLVLYDAGFAFALLKWKVPSYLTDSMSVGPLKMQVWDLADLLFVPAIGIVILLRFTRVSREQARTTAELGAAREIQRNLVPATLPFVPRYHIDAAYFPAAEVGGDLYQILPKADGSFLVAIGDVSGKGLKAAMTGAVAIGALRTLAAQDLSPALLLHKLNRQITAGASSGFITCLCVEVHPDGRVVLANAGHLWPYHNGVEINCGISLPLGLTDDADYNESSIRLAPGDKLTLLTDGVVEAQNPIGDLFGFERTLAISDQSARSIAQTALTFGQSDDITVLTVLFEG